MNDTSSHKSYRPVTVVSFRGGYYIADILNIDGLFFQRFLNVIIHAVIVQMVGVLYLSVFPAQKYGDHFSILASILFMLHPTHVESVINIANRAHLLSLLFALISMDISLNPVVAGLFNALGLLSCETSLFLYPAICLTCLRMDMVSCNKHEKQSWKCIMHHVFYRLARYMTFTSIAFGLVFMRHKMDWINIPEGLIRSAENPFYTFHGMDRFLNYSYILSIHIVKSLGMGLVDIVGFSHEYGFNCIEKIEDKNDSRLWIPISICIVSMTKLMISCREMKHLLLVLTFASWMATLFPVSGIIRVGTFIADRIVIASTVASSLLYAYCIAQIFTFLSKKESKRKAVGLILICLTKLSSFLWVKIQVRSSEWMHPVSLLESSLRNCPNSAKSHLEMAKVRQFGLYSAKVDYNEAFMHAKLAQKIDPHFCDVDFQLAQLHLKRNEIDDFEKKVTKAVVCKFTSTGALELFQRYWQQVLSSPADKDARTRYQQQLVIIEDAIRAEERSKAHVDNTIRDSSPVSSNDEL